MVCTKTYGFFNKKVRQGAKNRKFAPDRTFFGENRYTFEHGRNYSGFTRNCADLGPKTARRRVNIANLHATVLDFRENQHTNVHSASRTLPCTRHTHCMRDYTSVHTWLALLHIWIYSRVHLAHSRAHVASYTPTYSSAHFPKTLISLGYNKNIPQRRQRIWQTA